MFVIDIIDAKRDDKTESKNRFKREGKTMN